MAKTDSIVLLGDDRTTSEISKLLCNLPPAIQALSGVDITKVHSSITLIDLIASLIIASLTHFQIIGQIPGAKV